jgi:hypothetical protein
VGYYCVTGMAIMAAQGRSLGFSLVFATQDIPAMLRENDKEAKSIIANTTTKIFMRVEELEQTAKLATDSGGKGMKAQVGGFAGRAGEFNMAYSDDMSARIEQVDRISSLDLRALGVGEAYVTWHDQYFKVKTFHAYPEGQFKDLKKLELRVNHFIAVARPNPADVKKEETLPLIAEKLADPRFAQGVEKRAAEERGRILEAVKLKKDPTRFRDEISCMATAFGRANRKEGPGGDYLAASCAALAAITIAQINDANIFAKDVRKVEGLPEQPPMGLSGLPVTARSGKGRVPSEVPGRVVPGTGGRPAAPAGRAAAAARDAASPARASGPVRALGGIAGLPPQMADVASRAFAATARKTGERAYADEPPPPADDLDFDAEPDFDDPTAFTDQFGRNDQPTDPERLAAQRSDAPSTMRKVDHGVTVDGHDTFRMAEKLQNNDATLRFLEALNFDAEDGAEPGVEAVDSRIQKAVLFDDDETAPPPPKAAPLADPVEIERADVASAKATQWTERAKPAPASPAPARAAKEAVKDAPDLETAVRSGDVNDMTASYLAELLDED